MIVRLATTMDKLAARLTIIAVSRADHFIDNSTTKSAKREKPSPRYPPFSILTADGRRTSARLPTHLSPYAYISSSSQSTPCHRPSQCNVT
jgi:hypothetical protein